MQNREFIPENMLKTIRQFYDNSKKTVLSRACMKKNNKQIIQT
jgi:hypothetical protein